MHRPGRAQLLVHPLRVGLEMRTEQIQLLRRR